jgi:amino acid permease
MWEKRPEALLPLNISIKSLGFSWHGVCFCDFTKNKHIKQIGKQLQQKQYRVFRTLVLSCLGAFFCMEIVKALQTYFPKKIKTMYVRTCVAFFC